MPTVSSLKTIGPAAAIAILCLALLAANFAQNTQVSPIPTPSPSPTSSPTATPIATPSPTPLPGAQNFHQWGSITVFNGLPSDSVRAIAQTPDGVMWFGTDNGLARFDGRRIQRFAPDMDGSSSVTTLELIPDGLLVGTGNGAFVFADGNFQVVDGTQDAGVTSMLVDGETYLGTASGSVFRVDRRENETYAAMLSNQREVTASDGAVLPITSLAKMDGKLLAGTSGSGILVVGDDGTSAFSTSPRPLFVNALSIDDAGRPWIGSDAARNVSGIYLVGDTSRATRIAAPTSKVLTLEANESGVWAGSERFGLFHFEGTKLKKTYTFENTSGGLRSNTVYALFTDREGVLWIGTNRGVSRFDRLGPEQQTVSDIPNSNFLRTLWFNGRALYAGSNRGLYEFKWDDDETWGKVRGLEERVIYDIGVGNHGVLVGTATGTYDFRGRLVVSGDTRSIEYFGNKTYAAIIGRGVIDISSPRQNVTFSDEAASALLATSDRLWIGTAGHGLFSFDGKTTKPEFGPEVLKAGAIWNLSIGLEGSVWIAGQHGVFRIENGTVEKVIDAEDVRDVYIDSDTWPATTTHGDIWAATTTRGLLHARHDDTFGWLVTAVGFEQGLPSDKAFSIIKSGDGLLIATNRGVVKYKVSSVQPKLIPIRILGQRVHELKEAASTIALDFPQNSILVEVAGQSSRTFPEEFQYAFVLRNGKGDEVGRQLSNDPQYAPANLAAGEYAIEAVAFNRDLLASEPLTIRFSVAKAPFPWTATALAGLLVLAVAGLVWAVIEHRRIRQRNRELAAARLDLANEAERERNRIARDLHDQTLADLRNLMIKSDKGEMDRVELRRDIEAVSTEIRRICEDLSPSVLENVGLVPALEFLLAQSADNHRFSADENVEERVIYPINVQLQIYRIVQEVLTNIRRHSNADLVEMNVAAADDRSLLLTISDNGEPFDVDGNSGKGRGVSNIRSRANVIGARVEWEPGRDGGNLFSLSIEPKE